MQGLSSVGPQCYLEFTEFPWSTSHFFTDPTSSLLHSPPTSNPATSPFTSTQLGIVLPASQRKQESSDKILLSFLPSFYQLNNSRTHFPLSVMKEMSFLLRMTLPPVLWVPSSPAALDVTSVLLKLVLMSTLSKLSPQILGKDVANAGLMGFRMLVQRLPSLYTHGFCAQPC